MSQDHIGLLCVEYHDSVAAGEKGDGKGKPRARRTMNASLQYHQYRDKQTTQLKVFNKHCIQLPQ